MGIEFLGNIRGPEGKEGKPGLPGLEGPVTDAAFSEWVADDTTLTNAAVTAILGDLAAVGQSRDHRVPPVVGADIATDIVSPSVGGEFRIVRSGMQAIGNVMAFDFYLTPGVYELTLGTYQGTNGGNIAPIVDGVQLETLALYSATTTRLTAQWGGIVVEKPGIKRVTWKVLGKSSASTGYTFPHGITNLRRVSEPPERVAPTGDFFLDRVGVESSTGVTFAPVIPTKGAGAIFGDPTTDTWDRDKSFTSVVLRDGVYHMSYHSVGNDATYRACYASSTDGSTFTKPNLARFSFGGNTNNNIALNLVPAVHTIYDATSGLWVMVSEKSASGSSDGSWVYTAPAASGPWTQVAELKWDGGTAGGGYYTEGKSITRLPDGRWAVYYSFGHSQNMRAIGMWVSDGTSLSGPWTNLGQILPAFQTDQQQYSLSVEPVENGYLGFLMNYQKSTERIWMDLWWSRDGIAWRRIAPTWVGLGVAGSFDRNMIIAGSSLVRPPGDSWFFYYAGSENVHGTTPPLNARVGRASIRAGRLMTVSGAGGVLTTIPFTPSGASVSVNANATGGGVKVEVLDEAGAVLSTVNLSTDSTAHSVPVPAGPIKLRFTITGTSTIHGYTF